MDRNNRLDEEKLLINAMLCDAQTLHSDVFSQRSKRLTYQKICKRIDMEGLSFLTKSLPRLGKAFDRALLGEVQLDSRSLALASLPSSQLPLLYGELFQSVFSHNGWVLPHPCVQCIKTIRTLLYYFYKYDKEGYSPKQEQKVLSQFLQTEEDLSTYDEIFNEAADVLEANYSLSGTPTKSESIDHTVTCAFERYRTLSSSRLSLPQVTTIRRARKLLNEVFMHFDPTCIHPKHGPGAVSTKEKLWDKYSWSNIPHRISSMYPIDAYFYASFGHICDSMTELTSLGSEEQSARVLLVPKDSRGPRLISCEPLAFQWIQQGLGRAIVRHIEHHPLTRYNVHFTDQQPNQFGALLGSRTGTLATLDLKEASDRVSVGLVRLLFPSKVLPYLMASRSLATIMPDGQEIKLKKFAPMGSALCFPVLALTIWAILTASHDDADARERILVYGDDVILPTASAVSSIEQLESFGLLVNRDKSCITGHFRESCGVDAYDGINVTPLRLRKALSSTPSPDSYTSGIAQCNAFWERKYYHTYEYLANRLFKTYGKIPSKHMSLTCPSLYEVPNQWLPTRKRFNVNLQKLQWYVRDVSSRQIKKDINGWKMLLRYFSEATDSCPLSPPLSTQGESREIPQTLSPYDKSSVYTGEQSFSVSSYTKRGCMKMQHRWR
jgi:hypothetical protein